MDKRGDKICPNCGKSYDFRLRVSKDQCWHDEPSTNPLTSQASENQEKSLMSQKYALDFAKNQPQTEMISIPRPAGVNSSPFNRPTEQIPKKTFEKIQESVKNIENLI